MEGDPYGTDTPRTDWGKKDQEGSLGSRIGPLSEGPETSQQQAQNFSWKERGINMTCVMIWHVISKDKAGDFPGGPGARTPNARGPGSIPRQRTRSLMPQLKIPHAATKIPYATTKLPRAATKNRYSHTHTHIKRRQETVCNMSSLGSDSGSLCVLFCLS